MAKDRRIKGCPNPGCDRCVNIKKFKYKPIDVYCTVCQTELVHICAECLCQIEDLGPEHRICMRCESKRNQRVEKFKALTKKTVDKVGDVAADVAVKANDLANATADNVKEKLDDIKKQKRYGK